MQKITLLLLSLLLGIFTLTAQTHTTGTVVLSNTSGLQMAVQVETNASDVTLTLTGPSDRWLAVGFGGSSMSSTPDAFVFESSGMTDRFLTGQSAPSIDANQDWTISSNIVTGMQRTIIATRALNTGETNDYVFVNLPASISVIWARGGTASTSLAYHGGNNKGTTVLNSVLGLGNQKQLQFAMYPNPSNAILNVVLPSNLDNAKMEIFDVLARKVKTIDLTDTHNSLHISNLERGIYVIKITNSVDGAFGIQKLIKE